MAAFTLVLGWVLAERLTTFVSGKRAG